MLHREQKIGEPRASGETSQEGILIIQARSNDGFGPDGNNPESEKLWNPKYSLKIEPTEFPDGLDVQCKRKEREKKRQRQGEQQNAVTFN